MVMPPPDRASLPKVTWDDFGSYKLPWPWADERYFHWDELRYRPLPDDVPSHEHWWAGLKFRRRGGLNQVYFLKDKTGKLFDYSITDSIQEALHRIDLNMGGSVGVPDKILNREDQNRYMISSIVEEAVNSSVLEGAATTRRVARDMIRSGRVPATHGERMILNNYRAMQQIREWKDQQCTPEMIFALHRLVTEGTLEDPTSAGRLRRPGVADDEIVVRDLAGNVFHVPPAAEELPERMNAFCFFANGVTAPNFVHPVIRAIIMHFWLAYDHPFVDGNGRTARALFYWSILHSGYWLFEYVAISRVILRSRGQYERAYLYTETDETDLTYFILYYLRVIDLAFKEFNSYVELKTGEIRHAEARLAGMAELNRRQKALITHAIKHAGHGYTIESHRRSHGVAPQTARNDLLDLERRGLMTKRRVGKADVFVAVRDLEERLK